MTPNPRVGYEDDDVLDWLRTISNDRFRRLPVVDKKGSIKAILLKNFVSYLANNLSNVPNGQSQQGKHFNLTIIMIMLYSIAIIAAIKLVNYFL